MQSRWNFAKSKISISRELPRLLPSFPQTAVIASYCIMKVECIYSLIYKHLFEISGKIRHCRIWIDISYGWYRLKNKYNQLLQWTMRLDFLDLGGLPIPNSLVLYTDLLSMITFCMSLSRNSYMQEYPSITQSLCHQNKVFIYQQPLNGFG
jgi:hypothetical protein